MYGDIALKLIVGMLSVIFFLRLAGKAQMADITPLDTVSAFVIGALVGGIIYNEDMGITHLIFALLIWTAFNKAVRYLLKFKVVRKLIQGDSIYIVKDGILNIKAFKRHGLEMQQFRTLLRGQQIFSMFDVEDVRFETNGNIAISKKEAEESYLLVNNGSVLEASLCHADKTSDWLKSQLQKQGFEDLENLLIVEWTPAKGFYIVTKDDKIIKGEQTMDQDDIEDEVSA